MTITVLQISPARTLLVGPLRVLGDEGQGKLPKQFAALIPAHGNPDPLLIREVVRQLVGLGCMEICCVGETSEALHDSIDWIVEEMNALQVVTTWDSDIQEGCDYFLNVAGGKAGCLLALVSDYEAISALLLRFVADRKVAQQPP